METQLTDFELLISPEGWQSRPETMLEALKTKAGREEFRELMGRLAKFLPDKETYRNYAAGLDANYRYITEHLPGITQGGATILDVGPGVGCFMVLARAFGNHVAGEENALDVNQWIRAYAQIAEYWNLDIRYHGFHKFLASEVGFYSDYDLIHFRGSLDAVAVCSGLPAAEFSAAILAMCRHHIKTSGALFISHNLDGFSAEIMQAMIQEHPGYSLVQSDENCTHLVKA